MSISCGVPQGLIFGSLISILYINKLPIALEDFETYLYADITAIICRGSTLLEVSNKLATQLPNALRWLRHDKLTLNLKKPKIIYFRTHPKFNKIELDTLQTISSEAGIVKKVQIFRSNVRWEAKL